MLLSPDQNILSSSSTNGAIPVAPQISTSSFLPVGLPNFSQQNVYSGQIVKQEIYCNSNKKARHEGNTNLFSSNPVIHNSQVLDNANVGSKNVYKNPTDEAGRQFSCPLCEKKYIRNDHLIVHIRRIHLQNRPIFRCEFCFRGFSSYYQRECHIRVHAGEVVFPCGICSKRFKSNEQLSDHKKTHLDNNLRFYDCPYLKCKQRFDSCDLFMTHLYSEHTDSDRSTEYLPKINKYEKNDDLSKHSVGVYPPSLLDSSIDNKNSKKFKLECQYCRDLFSRKSDLKSHIKNIHSGQKQIKTIPCDFCSSMFSSKQAREHHHRIHTGEKPFVCTICGKRFPFQSYLSSHKLTHFGRNRFSCFVEGCGRYYFSESSRKAHILLKHTAVNTCLHCFPTPVSFATEKELENHQAIYHVSDQAKSIYEDKQNPQFKCKFCMKTYSRSDHLLTHVKRVHLLENNLQYICPFCKQVFSTKHQKDQHGKIHFINPINIMQGTILNDQIITPTVVNLKNNENKLESSEIVKPQEKVNRQPVIEEEIDLCNSKTENGKTDHANKKGTDHFSSKTEFALKSLRHVYPERYCDV